MDAHNAGVSLHAFILQTLAESARRMRLKESFARDAAAALHAMKSDRVGHELGAVKSYFAAMKKHRQGLQPKPHRLQPTRLG